MKKLSLLLIVLVIFSACSWFDGDQTAQQGVAQFGVSNQELSKVLTENTPHHVQITYLSTKNSMTTDVLQLSFFNDTYLSSLLQLDAGIYSLEEFIVMNGNDSVMYVSPKVGSDKADLVINPLPLLFTILKDSTTQVIPEVVEVLEDDEFSDFGYMDFSFIVMDDYDGFARCINRFGMDMFKFMAGNPMDSAANTFISPISISYAMGLLYSGSAGSTETLLKNLMYLRSYTDLQIKSMYKYFAAYLYEQSSEVEFSLAQAIWYQTGIDLLTPYVDAMEFYFASDVSDLDFAGDPFAAADTINDWAYDNTNGRIDDIVTGNDLLATVIALANATYFKAPFSLGFDSCMTHPDTFYVTDGSTTLCDMMNSGTVITVPYYNDEMVDVVTMPFAADSNFAMTMIMPSGDIDEFVENMDIEDWEDWLDNRENESIYLSFPKLMIEGDYSLKKTFQALGAGEIFQSVDVSRMTQAGGLFVGNILHNTFLNVNETGAEAAAVTVIMLDLGIHQNDAVKFNKPFLLVLHEEDTKTILFIGRIDKVEQITD